MNNDHLIETGGKYCQSTGDRVCHQNCESGHSTQHQLEYDVIYPDKGKNVTREKNTTSKHPLNAHRMWLQQQDPLCESVQY